jgi:hypothetical protein
MENRNLDLPSQKQILSLQRCSDTLNQAYTMFMEDWRSLLTACKENRRVAKFDTALSDAVARSTAMYDAVTVGYHPEGWVDAFFFLRHNLSFIFFVGFFSSN